MKLSLGMTQLLKREDNYVQGMALPNGNVFDGSAIIPELLSLYGFLQNKGYFLFSSNKIDTDMVVEYNYS